MTTTYRIHPAIGIARLGDSPDEFFVGPERVGEVPDPPGGFKDGQCRVKRQAARFRIYAHHDDGSVSEVTDAEAEISWTVHLVNSKAAYPGRINNNESEDDRTIDPDERVLDGPNQRTEFDGGTIKFAGAPRVEVPLGEIRTDDDNHLLVLGGLGRSASPLGNLIGDFWNNGGWYDDASDGPVTASITLRGSGDTPAVEPAWVVVGPPKFAPGLNSVTTLYDRLRQEMVDRGLLPAPTSTSYTDDVYPILQRARDMRWVETTFGAHTWSDPVTSQPLVDMIFGRLRPPGDMPRLNGGDSALTQIQYDHMARWQAGNYTLDWTGVPAPQADITPDGLDRAALEACVGGAFFPGIEAGGMPSRTTPILDLAYSAPFRLASGPDPGTISAALALPWQADFHACADNWWPVPRPNDVLAQGGGEVRWDRDIQDADELVVHWNLLGFVVKQGNEYVEVDHCDEASVSLLTPHLSFTDVPAGPMGMVRETVLAISFEVISPGAAVTLQYAPGGGPNHSQLVAATTTVTVGPTAPNAVETARLWLVYRTGATPSLIPTQTLTVREPVSGQSWQVTVDANTVARRTTATALVLDRSGSMAEDRGDGQSKHTSLQQAANVLVDLMLPGDGVGVVRYNEDAQALQQVLPLGDGGLSDLNRGATHDLVNGNALDPQGATSIGDGIHEGRGLLDAAAPFDGKALVVLTDGIENQPRWISDVSAEINATTYAVGLGQPHNISVPALQTISGNNGGFLLVTGAISGDNRFLPQKYFLQVLSGISNTEVVLDPDGELVPGAVHRIPFQLSDADAGIDVILLTPHPDNIDFRLQTPNGLILEPWRARQEPAMRFELGDGVAYFRLALPAQLQPQRFDQGGTWHALLTIGRPRLEPGQDDDGVDRSILAGRRAGATPDLPERRRHEHERAFAVAVATDEPGVDERGPARRGQPYSLVVHSYSTVSLRASARQDSYEPGAEVTVTATLTESGLPVGGEPYLWMDVTGPAGDTTVVLSRSGSSFTGTFATGAAGVYRARVRARGRTRRALPFVRERTVTVAVWRGDPPTPPRPDDSLCRLLSCLFGKDGIIGEELEQRLRRMGIDLDRARRCLAECHES